MADAATRLWGVVGPFVAAEGVELDDIEVLGGGRIVRVVLDADDLKVDRIADLSRGISRLLDDGDPIAESYTLEVTSPGLERKLRRPSHYQKSLGRTIKVKTHAPIDGERVHRGILAGATDDEIELETDTAMHRLAYGDIASATTVFVWEKNPAPGAKA